MKRKPGFLVVKKLNLLIINKIIENDVSLLIPDRRIFTEAIKDCDAVHFMMPFSLSMAAVKIARGYKKPTSAGFHVQAENVLVHLGLMNNPIAARRLYKYFYRHLYKYVDVIHYPISL